MDLKFTTVVKNHGSVRYDGGQNNHGFVGYGDEDEFLCPRAHIFCASSIKHWRKGSFADFCWNERKWWQKQEHHLIISHEQKVDQP